MPFHHSIFFLLLAFPILFTLSSAEKCHPDDVYGLLAFKSGITADPSGLLSSWTPDTDCCFYWQGITCRFDYRRVSALRVYGNNNNPDAYLSGTISPSITELRYLNRFDLVDLRNISGTFPYLLFHLPFLEIVYIVNSNLSGRLPNNIGALTRLNTLSLIGNRFHGPIPSSISNLTNLIELQLSNNLLTGTIPDGIHRLGNLSDLLLDWNQLSGAIPDFFASLPNLQTLALNNNNFTGKIPVSISTLAQPLRVLHLGHNLLTGQIPSSLGNLQGLLSLDLSSNRLTGSVPITFGNFTHLNELDLSHNFLVDPFPVMNTDQIEWLDISYNFFHLRKIPKWAASSPFKRSLKFAKCGLKTNLSNWRVKGTDHLSYIDLSDNEILGSAVGLLNRTNNLLSFKASNNQLKFNLEKLRFGKTLEELNLGRNHVFGKVPIAVLGLKNLNVSYNNLCGSIPPNNFTVDTFVGNGCLCGAPLTTPCKCLCIVSTASLQ